MFKVFIIVIIIFVLCFGFYELIGYRLFQLYVLDALSLEDLGLR